MVQSLLVQVRGKVSSDGEIIADYRNKFAIHLPDREASTLHDSLMFRLHMNGVRWLDSSDPVDQQHMYWIGK